MLPDDIGLLTSVSSVALSPEGRQAAFVVARVDLEANTYRSQIWLAPTDGSGPPAPLTAGDRSDANPTWSPDSRFLAFTSRRSEKEGDATLHVLPVGGPGEVRTLASRPEGMGGLCWSPDGRWLAFVSRTREARYDEDDESRQPPRRITRLFSQLDDEGWVVDRPEHVYVVAADGTSAARNLTPGEFAFGSPAWMPDSAALVCRGQAHDTWDLDLAVDLFLIRLETAERRVLTAQTGVYGHPAPSPDGTRIAFIGADDPLLYPQNEHVGVLDVAGGPHRWVSRGLDRTFGPYPGVRAPVWESDDRLLAVYEDRGNVHVARVLADGTADPVPVLTGERTISGFDAAAGTMGFSVTVTDRPAELVVAKDGVERQVTWVTDGFVSAARPQPAERFTAPSSGGVEVDAWIVRPPDFDATGRTPVLLCVHGGPHAQYGTRFFDEAQLYARAGYVVLLPNPRGSSGREEAWGQAILGPKHPARPGTGWGSVDVDDVLAVLDEALRRFPGLDPERVGMLGGSYGGWMATWLAAEHGERFAAICSERAANNLLALEWTSDLASAFRCEIGPSHLEDPDEYARMSPVNRAAAITVPMLLMHSEHDLRCPISQAEELFVALRLAGKQVELVRFPDEGHELSRSGSPVHRKQRAEILVEFFDRHLKPGPDAAST